MCQTTAMKTTTTSATSSQHSPTRESIKPLQSKTSTNKNTSTMSSFFSPDLFLFCCIIVITYSMYPSSTLSMTTSTALDNETAAATLKEVGYYGWITAISTGLGILPFLFFNKPNKFYMGISNALAAGMMIAASYSLAYEGFHSVTSPQQDIWYHHSGYRVLLGFIFGCLFMIILKYLLQDYHDEEYNICSLTNSSDGHKVIMIMLVMTLHSFSEGIGIGVSFGGKHGPYLGKFISLSLALHNIPEGIAIALILTSRGVSHLRTTLLCILSSIPQPIMAIPAYYFIEKFIPILPIGLGFASGAMLYVALFELLPEAVEDCKYFYTILISMISFLLMFVAQEYSHDILSS